MKQSNTNEYLKALNTLVNDNSKAEVLSHSTNKYINSFDFNQTVLFRL